MNVFSHIALFESHQTFRPSFEEMVDRWERNFTHWHEPKSNPIRPLHFDLTLPSTEAQRGGVLPIEVPIAQICPRCEGSGVTGFYDCDLCDGHGIDWKTARIDVHLSPPVRENSVIEIPLRQVGVRNFFLRVQLHLVL